VGERRLFAAIEAFEVARPGVQVVPRWHPFQLQPDLPAEGLPWRPFAEAKFGGWERARAGFRQVEQAAEAEGIAFRFETIQKANNTADAHRLILWAREHDAEWPVAHALFRAYFTDNRDLNDADTLAAIAADAGLDRDAAHAFLASDRLADAVTGSQAAAQRMGITGVPFFIVGDKYAFSGAQPQHVFAQALEKATE
jgi:predicted DsbA family dithiol-disulfide isomerase